eukprot:CAMPEP_0118902772 /NCGR_PEP_ID=MMETSP1166-20130328/7916_1 /TAXON_ID=1104430 /ORGANISM="Chrysoreinhardia sp, Strain CCMP3193" /LENGTH=74 /DNA_ID=CAMNT_0006841987 /DNA_START=86 /DNA_END=307 /DNA_ORIENTATION=+
MQMQYDDVFAVRGEAHHGPRAVAEALAQGEISPGRHGTVVAKGDVVIRAAANRDEAAPRWRAVALPRGAVPPGR